ncbi:MAG: hypothetical protein ACYS5V_08285, partial [Planctomycetota bacterium]
MNPEYYIGADALDDLSSLLYADLKRRADSVCVYKLVRSALECVNNWILSTKCVDGIYTHITASPVKTWTGSCLARDVLEDAHAWLDGTMYEDRIDDLAP